MATDQVVELNCGGSRVFEAWFGDKNGALALLQSPPQLRSFFLHVSDKADLPDTPPPGAEWEPFVRGWNENNEYYLIALTSPDTTAVRPGMVATRILAIPLADAEQWENLGVLFDLLYDSKRVYEPEHKVALAGEFHTPSVASPMLACVVHHLIHETKPAAIISQNGFTKLIIELWCRLPPALRRNFSFGLSFTPADLITSRANVVAVPTSCEPRWRGYSFQCNSTWNQPLSVSTAAFLNDEQAHGFLAFLNDVGLIFRSFTDYGRYARLWDDWKRRTENEPQISYSLLRGFGTMIPGPDNATAHKEEALRIAAGWLKNADSNGILAQRSVKAAEFPGNASELGRGISSWVQARFHLTPADEGGNLAQVILAVQSSQSPEWQIWVRNGVNQVLTPLGEPAARTLWSIWCEPGVFAETAAHLSNDSATENKLVRTFPDKLPSHLFVSLEAFCIGRGWLSLLAASVNVRLGFTDAVTLVLKQQTIVGKPAALELLCASARPTELWDVAFQYDDTTLQNCAVTVALANPNLWVRSTTNLGRWLLFLESAAKKQPDFLRTSDIDAIATRLFEAWSQGAPITTDILDALEKVDRLEFTGFVNRGLLWPMMPSRYLRIACTNTLRVWLADFYSNLPVEPKLEKELVGILFESRHIQFTFPRSSPSLGPGGLILIEMWGSQKDFETWLRVVVESGTQLPVDAARKAGALVSTRHWLTAARLAKYYDEDQGRQDFGPIWRTCYDSLGMLEKIAFDFFPRFSKGPYNAQHSTHSNSMTDVVFITALPEEFSAVRGHLSDRHEHIEKGTIYEIGHFRWDGEDCTVAVVQTGMGNSQSAAATERAIALLKPTFAIFVGIAGGLRDDLEIGDVIAADKVYGYESGKSASKFKPRPEATTVSHEALQRANAVLRDNLWQKRIVPVPARLPKALIKPIAAGEKVVASKRTEEFKRLTETYSDAHAVAMEEHGFCVAVKTHPEVCFAVVRGISDLIVGKQEADLAGSHDIAARNAAAFAFEMLHGLVQARSRTRENVSH